MFSWTNTDHVMWTSGLDIRCSVCHPSVPKIVEHLVVTMLKGLGRHESRQHQEFIEIASSHCSEQGKTYGMNLSAPFIVQVPPFKAVLMKTMPNVDMLFGNVTEAAIFAETEAWEEEDVPITGSRPALW